MSRLFFAGVVALGGGYASVCKALNVVNPGFVDGKTGSTFSFVQTAPKDLGDRTVLFAVNTADLPVTVDLDVAPFGPRRLAFRPVRGEKAHRKW